MSQRDYLGDRINKLRKILELKKLDAVLLSSTEALIHFGEMFNIEGYFIVFKNRLVCITDFRYQNEIRFLPAEFEVIILNTGFLGFLNSNRLLSGLHLGFEGSHLTYSFVNELVKQSGCNLVTDLSKDIERLTILTDQEMISRFKKAVSISRESYKALIKNLKSGISEKRIAFNLLQNHLENGADSESFPFIVAAGKNSRSPHHKPSSQIYQRNIPLLLDFGGVYKGMRSDVTRMIIPDSDNKSFEIYGLLKYVKEEVQSIAFPGTPVRELDLVTRDIFRKNKYLEFVKHSLGHGLGYRVHQPPRISWQSEEILEEGMIITLEPGLYFHTRGYRVEDDYLVTKDGLINLSKKIVY